MPQRLQSVARCWVVLTGTFLNKVANSSFIAAPPTDLMSANRATGVPLNSSFIVGLKSSISQGLAVMLQRLLNAPDGAI